MHIEEFALGNSSIHNLDPRVKIVAALTFSLIVALNGSMTTCAVAFCFPLALILAARISVKKVLARLLAVNVFIAMLWLCLPFTVPGEVIYSLGPLSISKEGIIAAFSLTLKSNVIVLAVIVLLGTSRVFTLIHAMSHLGVPDKLVHLFFFCFRYAQVIHEEYHRVINAAKVRGFRPYTNIRTYRTYAYLLGALLVKSFDRSHRIMAAMKCRGFKGKFYILDDYQMKSFDYLLAGSSLAFVLALLVVR
ncbi:MAG TPA: cobalt ECF transporter T component CbiQ [Desulfomonilaceae bacterium]|nr:cobalt ECF transporter T component CbiQ [Desulfomonilaceae bacterium]